MDYKTEIISLLNEALIECQDENKKTYKRTELINLYTK